MWGWACADNAAAAVCSDAALLQVDFDIATWDFLLHEEDPTSSEGPVSSAVDSCLELCL
jgi:hypothetical protein